VSGAGGSAAASLIETGWLTAVRRVVSPNCDARPPGCEPELLVIHGISLPPGKYGGPWIDALFTNTLDPEAHPYFATIDHLRVSAHLLIRRDGELVQYVPFHMRAWHAGASTFQGRERCNDFSIGIELEGAEEAPYTSVQYERLGEAIAILRRYYPGLTGDRIAGHSDIAPGRKRDPGPGFDWRHLHALLDRPLDAG